MSHCFRAMVAANSAVRAPTPATTALATGASANSTPQRATRYTPAVTIVAAWIRAETGVGPCIASGSHVYKGIWADLPVQPRNKNSVMAVISAPPGGKVPAARENTSPKSSDPVARNSRNIATRNPTSPILFTMNTSFQESESISKENQNASTREHLNPPHTQPTNNTG